MNDDDVFHADQVFVNNYITAQSPGYCAGRGRARVEGQEDRRTGRGRSGPDVRLRLRRDAGTDAGADHVCASSRTRADPYSQERQGAAGCVPTRRRRSRSSTRTASPRPSRTSSSPRSTPRMSASGDRRFVIEKVIKKVLPEEPADSEDRVPRSIRPAASSIGGPQGDTGLTGTQDHRRYLRRDGPARRRRVFGQGSVQGRSQRRIHGPLGGEECRGGRSRREMRSAVRLRHWPSRTGERAHRHVRHESVSEEKIERQLSQSFSFKPADIVEQLNLLRPIYSKSTNYGHFGKDDPDMTWERTDKAAALSKPPQIGSIN